MGDADGLLCGWCWRGWGRGSGDAAHLSGSRGLSLGCAHHSSLSKASSGTSEIVHLGIGKGTWCRKASGYNPNKRGSRRSWARERIYLSLQKPHSTEGWQATQAAKSCFLGFPSPPLHPPSPGCCAGRSQRCEAEPRRGDGRAAAPPAAGAQLRLLRGIPGSGLLRGLRHPRRGGGQTVLWNWIGPFLANQERGCGAARLSRRPPAAARCEAASVGAVGRAGAGTSISRPCL